MKRAIDLAIAAVLGVILVPLMACVALCVWASVGRPLLFFQRRPGLGGRLFTIWKFRTMRDTRDATGALLPDDDRTPRMGRWLRRLRLDEIPEIWNLLRGDMSLVGPRPLLPSSLEQLSPFERRRHEVRPGVTGWAQVNGNTLLTLQQKAQLDVWYVDHRSLWLDFTIVLKTIGVVVTGERISLVALQEAKAHADSVGRRSREHAGGAAGPG